jgi:multidrug efflux system membrane fusion protein
LVETKHGVTLIPSAGVQRGSQGTYVYIVNADQTVSLRLIKVGTTEGDNTSIDDGLKPGETVVIDGADKLRDGLKVEVASKDAGKPAAADDGTQTHGTHSHGKHGAADGAASTPAAVAPTQAAAPAASTATAATPSDAAPAADGKNWQGEHHHHHRDGDSSATAAGAPASKVSQ